MKTKHVLLLSEKRNGEWSDSLKYSDENKLEPVSTFTDFSKDYFESSRFQDDLSSIEGYVWNQLKVHDMDTKKVRTFIANQILEITNP